MHTGGAYKVSSKGQMESLSNYFATHKDRFINEWKEFLSFASVSTDPAYHEHCLACAEWVSSHLKGLGFHTEIWPSDTKPLVYGVLQGDPSRQTVLFYGHYDVQPVDPLNLWETPPFEPTLRDGRMYARGAQDNKGQVFFFLKAVEALKARGASLPTIKVIIEGEEECGSEAMHAGLHKWREPLKADVLMVCDTGMIDYGMPTITMGLRGVVAVEVVVHGPNIDLHSGVFGGVILNPLHALSKMVAGMFNEDGSIAISGFYDGIVEPDPSDRARAKSAPVNIEEMGASLGVPLAGGERALHPIERRGFRPTVEVNGIGGGYQGAGGKTVLPAHGMVKISSRIVVGQDPHKVLECIKRYFREACPVGARVEFPDESVGGRAFRLSVDTPVVKAAEKAIQAEFSREPVYLWEGATVPIIPELAATCGGEPILVGFGLATDQIHSPNESFSLRQLEEGFRYAAAFLQVV